jgi:hypothetical protein
MPPVLLSVPPQPPGFLARLGCSSKPKEGPDISSGMSADAVIHVGPALMEVLADGMETQADLGISVDLSLALQLPRRALAHVSQVQPARVALDKPPEAGTGSRVEKEIREVRSLGVPLDSGHGDSKFKLPPFHSNFNAFLNTIPGAASQTDRLPKLQDFPAVHQWKRSVHGTALSVRRGALSRRSMQPRSMAAAARW